MTTYLPVGGTTIVGPKGRKGKSVSTIIPYSGERTVDGYIGFGKTGNTGFTFTTMFRAPYKLRIGTIIGNVINFAGGGLSIRVMDNDGNVNTLPVTVNGSGNFNQNLNQVVNPGEYIGLYVEVGTTTPTYVNGGMLITPI